MNREDIDQLLLGKKNEALEAHKEIVSIQKDKNNLLKFGQKWLDDNLIGGLNNKMCFLGSRPGGGKTFHCSSTINNLLDRTINPAPVKILRLNLEMTTSQLLLREISRILGRKPSSILAEEYSIDERPKVQAVVNSFMDERITNVSIPLKGEDYRYMLQKFVSSVDEEDKLFNEAELKRLISENPEKEEAITKSYIPRQTKKVCLTDHLHIYLSKEVIDALLLIGNDMKLADKNLSFIYYFQFNRELENLWRESKDKKVNPRNILPNSTYIYLTDILQQVADLVVGMVIPQIYELDEFAAVHKERSQHLKEHFVEDNGDNAYVRVKGRNRIYYNLIKRRMMDSFDDPILFCDILNPEYEKTAEQIYKENKNPFTAKLPTFPTNPFPAENQTQTAIPTIEFKDLKSVFDSPVDDKNSPF